MDDNETKTWIDSLKVGDPVACRGMGSFDRTERNIWLIEAIGKKKKERVRLGNTWFGERGTHRFGSYSVAYLEPVTDEIRQDVRRRRYVHRLSKTDWTKLDDDKLKALVALLPEEKT
jgi:hypothetical protein